jgi:hypothetical protein
MSSLQVESNFWYHSINEPPLSYTNDTNYQLFKNSYLPIINNYDDINIPTRITNSFIKEYVTFSKRFKSNDMYTLFIPLLSTKMDNIIYQLKKYTKPYEKIYYNELIIQRDNLLKKHMFPYKIIPSQLQHGDVLVENILNEKILYTNVLQNDLTNIIHYYIINDNSVLYFISHELY